MGEYIYVQAIIKSKDGSENCIIGIDGFEFYKCKWDHPILYLFGFDFGTYSFLSNFFGKILSTEDKSYLDVIPKGENFFHTEWLEANELLKILEKINEEDLFNLSNQFESDDDYNGHLQLLLSISQLKTMAEIEKSRASKIRITIMFD